MPPGDAQPSEFCLNETIHAGARRPCDHGRTAAFQARHIAAGGTLALLSRQDLARQSHAAWLALAVLAATAVWLWVFDKRAAAEGSMAALVGCLGLILPPRERMAALPRRLRALPRRYDVAPVLATLVSVPGYGLNWFYGANPYDEAVHLLSGGLIGWVWAGLLATDGRRRSEQAMVWACAGCGLAIGSVWEAFEWATGLIGDAVDTVSDIALTALGAILAGAWAGRRRPAPAVSSAMASAPRASTP